MRKRIEAALADHLKHCDEPVGSFQEKDVQYVQRQADEEKVEINIVWQQKPLGVPDFLEA